MTNAERKAEWLAVANYLYSEGYIGSTTQIKEEAERRFPTIRATKDFKGERCIEVEGRRVLQYKTVGGQWASYNGGIQDAINAPYTKTVEDPSK